MAEKTEVTLSVRYLDNREKWRGKEITTTWNGAEPNTDESIIEASFGTMADAALRECDSPLKFEMGFTVVQYNNKNVLEREESGVVTLSGDSHLWVECINTLAEALANDAMQYL